MSLCLSHVLSEQVVTPTYTHFFDYHAYTYIRTRVYACTYFHFEHISHCIRIHRSPSQRNKATFQHRLCIRISTCAKEKTLSITDLGAGMTRSDLINSLGVGSRLSPEALAAVRNIDSAISGGKGHRDGINEDDGNEDDNTSDESESDDDSESESDDDESESVDDDYNTKKTVIPCKAADVGGFYSAFCSLGTSVEIGTKVSYIISKQNKKDQKMRIHSFISG
jgi:hypothetical protein